MLANSMLSFLVAFLIAVVIGPIVILLSKKFKASQTILEYVEGHKIKQGTPTMGGFIFVISISICTIIFCGVESFLAKLSIIIMLAFCILGFMDDFIKIKFKQNEGLKPYQKIVSQFAIASIVAFFCYYSPFVGSSILLPFSFGSIDLGIWIIPFVILFFIAVTNSVNLIDGLDGLSGSVSLAFLMGIGALVFVCSPYAASLQISNLALLCIFASGALLGYLCFNIYPAKIFMGDTGSLALGGLIAGVCVFLKMEIFLVIIGIMYVLTAISDIIQVLYYKKTKKRVFLMAPLHHHFEKKGINENKITFIYFVITLIIAGGMILLCM
ncbi:MAG: phospho-N-acetylmuramoyl-pentapeptide-transferase [Clostridia bacterium]